MSAEKMRTGVTGLLLASAAWGQNAKQNVADATNETVDKSAFSLFNPTTREAMREMSTDRPDITESPITVDAGHFQFELSFFHYAYNDDGGVQTNAFGVLPSNIKVGLLNNVDIQFVFTPYEHDRFRVDGQNDTVDGFSDDTQLRLKMNFWGNDGPDPTFGKTAFAFMPFVKFLTGSGDLSNDRVKGGLSFPFAFSLPGDWDVGVMAEIDFTYNEARDRYGVDFVHSVTASHGVPGATDSVFTSNTSASRHTTPAARIGRSAAADSLIKSRRIGISIVTGRSACPKRGRCQSLCRDVVPGLIFQRMRSSRKHDGISGIDDAKCFC